MHRVLCFNAGSSSLKFASFRVAPDREDLELEGAVERIGQPRGRIRLEASGDRTETEIDAVSDLSSATRSALDLLDRHGVPVPDAVGHRLVHGGPAEWQPAVLDEARLAALRRVVEFAPLHLPGEIRVVEAVRAHAPTVLQVGCFDTAFHHDLPESASRLPLPEDLSEAGVRRYGFHGLSYEYVVASLGAEARGRLLVAHLGSGSSLAAVLDGRPVDTTMGLTPTGGVLMATRTGDLDPGVLPFLARRYGWDADRLEHLINFESGLLGVSGTSADMETLLRRRAVDPRAGLAVELFCRSVRKHVGALATVLGGIDTLVFTGGIGENSAEIRAAICDPLDFLGLRLDPERNAKHADVLSPEGSACRIRRIETDEARMIARRVGRVLLDRRSESQL